MSKNWVKDINKMHEKYGVHEWVKNNQHQLKQFLDFRLRFLYEEANETSLAVDARDAEEIVDGLIDICVVAIGTLDAFGVDANKAWIVSTKRTCAKRSDKKTVDLIPSGYLIW